MVAGGGGILIAVVDKDKAASERSSDLQMVARGGAINLVGALANGLFQFLLVVAVAQVLHTGAAGAFFEAIALFLILSNTCELGADTGLTRMIPRYRVTGRIADVRASLGVGIYPALISGMIFAVVVFVFAVPLAEFFTNHRHANANQVASYIRVMAIFLPISCAYTVAIAATRGFGTMVPNALIDRIGKSGLQLLLVGAVVVVSGRPSAIAAAWCVPLAIGLLVGMLWLMDLVRGVETRASRPRARPTPVWPLFKEFWAFTAPRGLTGVFQVTILWVGTLMVGSLIGAGSASIYTASTRYLVAGSVVNMAIIQVIAPKLSELMTGGLQTRARDVYQVATSWLMMLAWPMYFALALFAPVLLRVFGHHYAGGATALAVLAVAMLVATGIGPVDVVLLMGGRSTWNLFNVVVALILNVAISLILIPKIGITGAAIAWAAAILFNNIAPLLEVRAFLKVDPFGRGFPAVATCAILCFGVFGAAVRLSVGATIPAFIAYMVVASLVYAGLLFRFRERMELPLLWDSLGPRMGRGARG